MAAVLRLGHFISFHIQPPCASRPLHQRLLSRSASSASSSAGSTSVASSDVGEPSAACNLLGGRSESWGDLVWRASRGVASAGMDDEREETSRHTLSNALKRSAE